MRLQTFFLTNAVVCRYNICVAAHSICLANADTMKLSPHNVRQIHKYCVFQKPHHLKFPSQTLDPNSPLFDVILIADAMEWFINCVFKEIWLWILVYVEELGLLYAFWVVRWRRKCFFRNSMFQSCTFMCKSCKIWIVIEGVRFETYWLCLKIFWVFED